LKERRTIAFPSRNGVNAEDACLVSKMLMGLIWAPSVELSTFATSHAFRAERRILAAPSAR
jgi:hypothetical protein